MTPLWYLQCQLLTDFTCCSTVSTVDFERVNTGWDREKCQKFKYFNVILFLFFSFKHKLSIHSSSVQRYNSMSPRNGMNFDVKQEKERVNQYLRDEKVSDTSVLVQVQTLCAFCITYSRNEALTL